MFSRAVGSWLSIPISRLIDRTGPSDVTRPRGMKKAAR